LKGAHKQEGERLYTRVDSDGTRGNGLKLRQTSFRLDVRRKFFTQTVVTHWNRLAKEVVDAPPWRHSRTGWMGLWAAWSGGW